MKKILFRTDAGVKAASGHIIRCLSVASALKNLGFESVFVFAFPESEKVLKAFSPDQEYVFLKSTNVNFEIPELCDLAVSLNAGLLFFDSYDLDLYYFKQIKERLKESCKTAYIDDLCNTDVPVDLVINYDLILPKNLYSADHKLLGPSYAPLRLQFAGSEYQVNEKIDRILITTGGTDPYLITEDLIKSIEKITALSGIKIDAIIGALFPESYKERLHDICETNPDISFYENVMDMSSLMKKCDLALTAGGSTVYELCAVGVPSLVFTMADNQVKFVKEFADAGAIDHVCDLRNVKNAPEILAKAFCDYSQMYEKRLEMSSKARALIDGKGSIRIAEEAAKFLS